MTLEKSTCAENTPAGSTFEFLFT